MTNSVRNTVLSCVVLITVVLIMLFISKTYEPQHDLQQLQLQGLTVLPKSRQVSNFELINHQGKRTLINDLQGHWSVLFFGFTHCPDICPTTLATLARASKEIDASLAKRLQWYMVSVDPDRDTPAKLSQYVHYFSSDFIGLTGEHATLAEFAGQVGVAFAKVPDSGLDGYTVDHSNTDTSQKHAIHLDGYTVDHSMQLVIFNPKGHYHAFIKAPHTSDKIALFLTALDQNFNF